VSESTETAILAAGCFWQTQELLRHRPGIISIRVGYTGGDNDTLSAGDHLGYDEAVEFGHAEAVEVTFDPGRTSFRDILEYYFQMHRADLGEEHVGSEYRSEIFYASDEQRRIAEITLADMDAAKLWPGKVVTRISPAAHFWEADVGDQHYLELYPEGRNQFRPE
jgi:peptide-methionine (S)-S-oxide reductase